MFPGFSNMDPYTQYHIPSPYHCYPIWEPRPLHMKKMDSFSHPSPCVERHGCCNRDHPPGYYTFRPPYFHYQHPPQMYYNAPYPPYHDAYTPYFIPPPHFDRSHCCGCPNHTSHGKEGSNVKIEEQKATPTIEEAPVTMSKGNHNGLLQSPNNHPVMWLPDNFMMESLPVLNLKDNMKDSKPAQEESAVEDKKQIYSSPKAVEEPKAHSLDQVAEKGGKIKMIIPVMHLDSSNGEKLKKPEDVLKNCTEEKKHGTAKKQPSPLKTSKLPPVCLRVEPLPKKNGSNGKGRSKEEAKPVEDNNEHGAIKKKDSEIIPTFKDMDVKHQPSAAAIIEEQCGDKDREDATTDVGVQDKGNVGDGREEREDFSISKALEIVDKGEEVDITDNDNKKQAQKNCSPEEAALLVQSAFRGYNVRRWKPLEKLRKIAQIREQVNNIRSQIQNYEGCSELDGKQKVIFSETIMNLLLQLDTIQGLLPSLREVRKSVARDLAYLQDKLDQLCSQLTNKHEEGTPQKDETISLNSAASDITLTSQENNCDGASIHVMDKNLLEQPPSLQEEKNMSVQETGASSMVPLGDECHQAPQKEDGNDRVADISSNIVKASESQAVAVAQLPPVSEVPDSVLTQQPDNPSISYLERQISEEELVEAKMVSEVLSNSEEGEAAIEEESSLTAMYLNPEKEKAMVPTSEKEDDEIRVSTETEIRAYAQHEMNSKEKNLAEDNEKLRWMLEKLLRAGQEQMGPIVDLNERVKNLERKLSKRKKVRVNQKKLNKPSVRSNGEVPSW